MEDRGDLEELEAMLRIAVEDEESEAAAYYKLASMASSGNLRSALRAIADDSVVHAEVLRGLLRAIERIRAV
ncbi:MAG: hypothetical protein QI199_08665, partial [Candidatus Korarchaeota archaeon]|nr:hypothetical protein [Candidatus Korarchaeota archaeon]